MVKYKSLYACLISLVFLLSFVSSEIISPLNGFYQLNDPISFNISVNSSVSNVLYDGAIVPCDLSDGYCEFSYYADELGLVEGLNTVSFVVGDEIQSVSFYYYKLFHINSPSDGACTNQDSISFNISVNSSVSNVLYDGAIVPCDLSDGYCEFSYYADELGLVEGLNTVSFTANDETRSVSICYDTTAPNITVPSTITQVAPSASGDIVNYNVSSNEGTVLCSPASGSTFVVGDTIVVCNATDLAGNFAEKNFTVTITYTAPVTTTSSTGGSGGGSCSTQWTVSEWSQCTNGVQTRTVSYPTNYCAPRSDKPLELRSCTAPASSTTNTTELNNQTKSPSFVNTLTGNVIGTTAGRWSLGIIIFLIVIGLAYWIVAKKRKAVAKPAPVAKVSSKKGKK